MHVEDYQRTNGNGPSWLWSSRRHSHHPIAPHLNAQPRFSVPSTIEEREPMKELVVTQDSVATPDNVWRVLTDLDNAVSTISAIEKIERLDGGSGFDVGTTWRETRTMFGKTATEDMTVTELDLGRSYTTEARSHGAYYRSTHLVEPIEGGSRITMAFGAEPTSAISRIFSVTIGRLFDSYTRKALAKDLTDIAAAAEGSP